ncbi:MAG TPA: Asp-tRNA(Asn)/Glu-tRNA(Gln) amidotransferase subunit GatA [Acidobacteriota bacterium]|nr:Asp-tRNA(Asn)/Glu-tRNA(Gln) amidotransferase subunit GatA [Acidobacteriota bacterium]
MTRYQDLAASDIVSQVADGRMRAVDVARQALKLAGTEGRQLNAFITICEEKALVQAGRIDEMSVEARAGLPLCGVPVAIKDNISCTGYPTTCGSRILDGYVPPYDATAVGRLIQAGAVIIGKTNMDEFAMGSSSETSCYGPVKNPLDHSLTPGGSSGGSAAAVAQGIVPIALGSETGGSVRQPASFCGLLGLKPSYGAVSRYGLVAYASSTDQISPLARNVTDLATVYRVICGHDPHDATSAAFDHPDYPALLESDRKYRLGIIEECFAEGLAPDVEKAVSRAVRVLQGAGHAFVKMSLPSTEHAVAAYYIIAPAEASANLARFDGVRYGLRRAGHGSVDEMYARTRSAGFGPEVRRRIMLGTFALSSGYYEAYYMKASRVRELIRREYENAFTQVDLLISPTSPTPAFRLGEKADDPLAMYLSDVYTIPASLAGVPAISVPFGTAADGRTIGIQLTAPLFGELSLFRMAAILQRHL